jgi:hypothetical protein
MTVEISRELLAAIGEVTVETAKLEYAVIRLVAARRGWDDLRLRETIKRTGAAKHELNELVMDERDWLALKRLRRDVVAVLNDRNALVHAVTVIVEPEDNEGPHIEFWHARSGAELSVSVTSVEELAFDVGRCFARAVKLIPEAESRNCAG